MLTTLCGCGSNSDMMTSCTCAYKGLFLPYGDGASFSGFRKEAWPVAGPGSSGSSSTSSTGSNSRNSRNSGKTALTFRGIKNLDAAIDWAFLHGGLAEATELVLSGGYV